MRRPHRELQLFQEALTKQKRDIQKQFESQLADIGLAVEQIESQTLSELEASLERVNDALQHPESFGTFNVKMTANLGLFVTSAGAESHFQIGIVPILLERKKLILERIRTIKEGKELESLKGMIESISESDIKERLEQQVEEIFSFSRQQDGEAKALESERLKAEMESQEKLQKLEIEMMEKKATIRRSYFEKDSIAPLVGGLLLLVLAGCLIVAMFTEIQSTDIVDNAFLLILGYFFGQSVVKQTKGNDGEKS